MLDERGIKVSEATCGRLLRTLEELGYAAPKGQKGRVITTKGSITLDEWQRERLRRESQSSLFQSLQIQRPDELLDVLVARRAIESETAALAALHATEDDLRALRQSIREQEQLLESGASVSEENTVFHLGLARAGKNQVLVAALETIYRHPDVMRALERIRAIVGSKMVEDHSAILAEVERRDPDRAREAMINHMNNLIRDVDRYWKERGSSASWNV